MHQALHELTEQEKQTISIHRRIKQVDEKLGKLNFDKKN